MRKITTLLMAVICCLCFAACRKTTKQEALPISQTQTTQALPESGRADVEETTADSVAPSIELIGPWHLDSEKNDLAAFADSLDLFPGYGEWGASMEIRSNGQMSWYIGAEGWQGTYTVEGGVIHAQLVSDLDQSTKRWDLRITAENGTAGLEMDHQDRTIYWVYGDQEDTVPSNWEKVTEDEPWKVALAEDLFEKYGVRPVYYEDLGDGIYQVYVEVGGEIVPFVAANAATGDYHGRQQKSCAKERRLCVQTAE